MTWQLTGNRLEDALHACALRFEGYRWIEHHWSDPQEALEAVLEAIRLRHELPGDVAVCFATRFALQRSRAREDGWFAGRESVGSPGAWLFLHLYCQPTPIGFSNPDYEKAWASFSVDERETLACQRRARLLTSSERDSA